MQKRIPVKLPIANILSTASRGLAVTAISGYQKFISPHKGFACAHRVLYGCESCSQYFKRVIAEDGIFEAIANAKGRFQECREANEIVKNRRAKRKTAQKYYARRMMAIEPSNPDNSNLPEESDIPNSIGGSQWDRKKRSPANNNNNNCDYFNGCIDCADLINAVPSDCGNGRHCDNADCLSGMDCSGLDCGSLDCGSLDCSVADCGSCG